MRYIYLQPVGEIEEDLLNFLAAELKGIFDCVCNVAQPVKVPEGAYNKNRNQYSASGIVEKLAQKIPRDAEKLLGIIDVDLFVPELNFVFGLASGDACIISLARLRPEYYGEEKNELLFRERALKEAVHEFGHTFGLHHCPDIKCVMHFSNSIADTDIKSTAFCRSCSTKIGLYR